MALLWYSFSQMSKNDKIFTIGLYNSFRHRADKEHDSKQVIKLHSLFTRIEWEFQGDEQVNGESNIIGDRAEFENHVKAIVDLAKLSVGRLIRLIESNQIKDILDIDITLELVNVHCDQDHVVVRKGLKKGNFADETGRMLAALFLQVVQSWDQQADFG